MGHPRPLSRPVGSIPSDGSKSLFTDPAITTRPFPVLWPHSHAIANHFPIGHPSFHYSSSSTLNSGVLSGCAPEKNATSSLRPPTGLKTPLRSELRWLTSSDTTYKVPTRPRLMGHPRPLSRPVGPIPSDGRSVNIPKARNHCLLTLQSPPDLSPCFGLTRTLSRITSR
ncbi:hypothetical protein YC2023_001046 [Brassica napus]